jgi:hypothetical protein
MSDHSMGSAPSVPDAVIRLKRPPPSDTSDEPSLIDETSVLMGLAASYEEACANLSVEADRDGTDPSVGARLTNLRAELNLSLLRLSRLPVTTFTEAAVVLSAAERFYLLEGEERAEDAFARHLVSTLLRLIMSLKVDGQVGATSRRPSFPWFGFVWRDRGN